MPSNFLRVGLTAIFLIMSVTTNSEVLNRSKRFVLYPYGGTFKMVLGFAVPVMLGSRQNMGIGWNFQFQYTLPTNTTQIETYPPIISRSRDKRSASAITDRASVYLGIEAILNSYGLDGRSCLLKSICEAADLRLDNDANGLYGRIMHIVLTPDYGDGEVDNDLDPEYMEAHQAGKFGIDCVGMFPRCYREGGLLDVISILDV